MGSFLFGGGGRLKRTRLQSKVAANREKYREFHSLLRFKSCATEPKPASRTILRPSSPSPGKMRNTELILAYHGICRVNQGFSSQLRLRLHLPKHFIPSAPQPRPNTTTTCPLLLNISLTV